MVCEQEIIRLDKSLRGEFPVSMYIKRPAYQTVLQMSQSETRKDKDGEPSGGLSVLLHKSLLLSGDSCKGNCEINTRFWYFV